jgi:hypothetical protein
MNCEGFLNDRKAGVPHDEASLAHLRSCASCLDAAVAIDPDDLFRSLGGVEEVPPGGIDLFVAEVVREVEMRQAERKLSPARRVAPAYRWAAAAALIVGVATSSLHRFDANPAALLTHQVAHTSPSTLIQPVNSRPVVEDYENSSATIVEVPADKNDVAVVMIFDQNLPADL